MKKGVCKKIILMRTFDAKSYVRSRLKHEFSVEFAHNHEKLPVGTIL